LPNLIGLREEADLLLASGDNPLAGAGAAIHADENRVKPGGARGFPSMVPARDRSDRSVDQRRRQQDERRHDDPSDKPRLAPLAYEHPLAEEWRAGNPGGDCAGETGLDESEYEITIALRNQHYSLCSPK
jgi:hypothetical protein